MTYLHISLNKNRLLPGNTFLYGASIDFKRFSCYAKADDAEAAKAGNPTRNYLFPDGDACPGQYIGKLVIPTPAQLLDSAYLRSYGPNGIFNLTPKAGLCLTALANKRTGLALHGGDVAANGIDLRPTFGCVRQYNADMRVIVGVIGFTEIEVNITELQ